MRDVEEVARLLRITFAESGSTSLHSADLVRFWALDMQWFAPEVAEEVCASLVRGGWLRESDGSVQPMLASADVEIPLGWRPIARRLIEIERMPEAVDGLREGMPVPSAAVERATAPVVEEEKDLTRGAEGGDEPAVESHATAEAGSEDAGTSAMPGSGGDESRSEGSGPHPVEPAPTEIADRPTDPWVDRIPAILNHIAESSGLDSKEVMRRAQRKRRALGPVTLWMSLMLVAREQRIDLEPMIGP